MVDESSSSDSLRADVEIRGVWQPQGTCLFDVRVIDSDAPSYLDRSPEQILKTAEREKKAKYSEHCERRHVSFSPLCATVDGLIGPEMSILLQRLADRLALK
uniref:Uncharacterized protein n=1 Tax=Amphimedon queenslandica TaxID=400682 RepID=A0A1X7SY36_AMPQE